MSRVALQAPKTPRSANDATFGLAVDAALLETRQSSECYETDRNLAAYARKFVYPLYTNCRDALGSSQEPWTRKNCVAAAIATDMEDFAAGLSCNVESGGTVSPISTWPNLDYNVYASIVGDCAWSKDGCPITQQNFVDLIYSSISQETSAKYPPSAQTLIDNYIKPMFDWAGFTLEQGIPYTNFNDWLHYSGAVNHGCPNGTGCTD
ncbi:hypothetical protein PENSPDRAFT_758677 [Peniophora sp. CONT]|nr:hypothetical protein PENSPDRAFT_758677 [Peniophora sp. CONT]